MINKKLLTYLIEEDVLEKFVRNTEKCLVDNDIFDGNISTNFIFPREERDFWHAHRDNYNSLTKPIPLSSEKQKLYDFIEFLHDNDALGKYFVNRLKLRHDEPLFSVLLVSASFYWDATPEGEGFWRELDRRQTNHESQRKRFEIMEELYLWMVPYDG